MNTKKLKSIYSTLEGIKEELTSLFDKETEIFENKSDRWKESDKGQSQEEKLSYLESSINDIELLLLNLDNASVDDNA